MNTAVLVSSPRVAPRKPIAVAMLLAMIVVIIRRTTSYALVTGLLAHVYFGSIVVLQGVLFPFTAIMASLNLPYPKFIDHAVPGNKACGECPTNLPQELQKYCGQMAESPQG